MNERHRILNYFSFKFETDLMFSDIVSNLKLFSASNFDDYRVE
jgi:hypothetical protein